MAPNTHQTKSIFKLFKSLSGKKRFKWLSETRNKLAYLNAVTNGGWPQCPSPYDFAGLQEGNPETRIPVQVFHLVMKGTLTEKSETRKGSLPTKGKLSSQLPLWVNRANPSGESQGGAVDIRLILL